MLEEIAKALFMSHIEATSWAIILDKTGWKDYDSGTPSAIRNSAILAKCLGEPESKMHEVIVHNLSLKAGGGIVFEYN